MIVDLLSPLSRAECAKRLHQHVSGEWSLVTDSGVVGSVNGDTFVIRKHILYRNSFKSWLHGTLTDAPGGGTRIHGETREANLRWAYILAAVIAVVAFAGVAITMFQHRDQLHDVPLAAIIGPALVIPVLIGIMIGATAIGRALARSTEPFLVDWLKHTLEARPAG